jgi:ssDNA-binding Zn-finger/Zn-ribbon topoisomerase 1
MIDCPTCGAPMVSRKNNATGQRFWGCSKFPTCKGTRDTDGEPPRRPRNDDERAPAPEPGLPSERHRQADRRRWR